MGHVITRGFRRLPLPKRSGRPARRRLVLGAVVASGFGLMLLWLAGPTQARGEGQRTVLVARVQATITPVVADHLRDGIRRAERDGHVAFVIQIDTPGGLDTSMRAIVKDVLDAGVPVVVYVAPSGARAGSAGAIIALSAHVTAMAPGTNIGAATPIDLQGGDVSRKVINDLAAYAESIAQLRGRSIDFAGDAVREGRSVSAEEAVRVGAVDLMADTTSELLDAIDGRTVLLASGAQVILRTTDAGLVAYEMSIFRQILQWLADPNIAFLFLTLGALAVIVELASPGMGVAGAAGVIMLVLGLYSLTVLPVTVAGGALLVLALVLFVAELVTPGIGAFAAAGSVALVAAGLFLFQGAVEVDLGVLVPTAVVTGVLAVLAGRIAWRSRLTPASTGIDTFIGRTTVVRAVDGERAQALIDGAWWKVMPRTGPLRDGDTVHVVEIDGLDLIVEPQNVEPPDVESQAPQHKEPMS